MSVKLKNLIKDVLLFFVVIVFVFFVTLFGHEPGSGGIFETLSNKFWEFFEGKTNPNGEFGSQHVEIF